eukprot:scaffold4081_cov268-Pinguiococcus_pyrenoidosus.AAC.9
MSEEALSTFCSATGAPPAVARQYLEMTAGDVSNAVQLFVDLSGGAAVPGSASATSASQGAGKRSPEVLEDGTQIRPPDMTKRQRLIAPPNPLLLGPGTRRSMRTRYGPFAEAASAALNRPPPMDFRRRLQGAAAPGGSSDLEALYAPPADLVVYGNFDEVRRNAKASRRWLLVNIQDKRMFDSHRLNRDVFRDQCVREIIQHGFVLWQMQRDSPNGLSFMQRYRSHVSSELPLLCVVDPRTGGVKWSRNGFVDPDRLIGFLSDFVASQDLGEPRPLEASGGAGQSGVIDVLEEPEEGVKPGSSQGPRSDADVVDLVGEGPPNAGRLSSGSVIDITDAKQAEEDRKLPAEHKGQAEQKTPVDTEGKVRSEEKAPSAETKGAEPPEEATCASFIRDREALIDEPEKNAAKKTTRVQLQFPDGRKVSRRFFASQSVGDLFRFAASHLESYGSDDGSESVPRFDLRTVRPARSLADVIEEYESGRPEEIVVNLDGKEGPSLESANLLMASCVLHLIDA